MGWDGIDRTFNTPLEAAISIVRLDYSSIKASSTRLEGKGERGAQKHCVYIAYENTKGHVLCVVVLVESTKYDTMVKMMSEFDHPYYFSPSKQVIAELSPLSWFESYMGDYAMQNAKKWRIQAGVNPSKLG